MFIPPKGPNYPVRQAREGKWGSWSILKICIKIWKQIGVEPWSITGENHVQAGMMCHVGASLWKQTRVETRIVADANQLRVGVMCHVDASVWKQTRAEARIITGANQEVGMVSRWRGCWRLCTLSSRFVNMVSLIEIFKDCVYAKQLLFDKALCFPELHQGGHIGYSELRLETECVALILPFFSTSSMNC